MSADPTQKEKAFPLAVAANASIKLYWNKFASDEMSLGRVWTEAPASACSGDRALIHSNRPLSSGEIALNTKDASPRLSQPKLSISISAFNLRARLDEQKDRWLTATSLPAGFWGTITGNCSIDGSRHSPTCHKKLFHASWLSDKYL